MSNIQNSSLENGRALHGNIPIEGTAARTRPFSLEEALLRRKSRQIGPDLKYSSDTNAAAERKDSNRTSDLVNLPQKYEKDVEDVKSGISSKKEFVLPEKEEKHLRNKGKSKSGHELEGNVATKAFDSNAKHQSRDNNETSSHHRRAKDTVNVESKKEVVKKHAKGFPEGDKQDNKHKVEERYKSESESGTLKKRSKHTVEDSHYDKSRKGEKLKPDHEKESIKKRSKLDDSKAKDDRRGRTKDLLKDEPGKETTNKHHKDVFSKDDRRIRDDDRYRGKFEFDDVKQRSKLAAAKDRDILRERSPPRDDRRLYQGHNAKFKSEFDRSSFRRYDSRKVEYEDYSDRKYRRYEETTTKRRRSRSRSPDYGRERSLSVSPRNRRHYHYRKDYAETSSLNSKERSTRKHLEVDKYRTSESAGYEGGLNQQRSSGLGGYSPRKRKTEAITESLSPIISSPVRKSTVDQPSVGSTVNSQPTVAGAPDHASSITVSSTFKKAQTAIPSNGGTTALDTSLDYVQLTQATRPKRRLYIENLPTSVSDKDVIEWLNGVLLSSGANHIPGSSPCISCIVNKEKSQAVVEFLTPEDATAALAFDGRSFSGSTLKIRRPKDFTDADAITALLDKPVAVKQTVVTEACHSVSDIVENSPNKIFVGGISKLLSAEMFMEIANAFGVLKSYHLETNEYDEPCAFLEYLDPSITLTACCGLNGMKLGGHILTAVLAFPDAYLKQELESAPSYTIPDHAKPLLQNPTKVLKLKYVFNPEDFVFLSESELEETMEDVRLECSRFGSVKSMKIIRYNCTSDDNTESSDNISKIEPEAEAITNENEASKIEPIPCQPEALVATLPTALENANADDDKQNEDTKIKDVPMLLGEDDSNSGLQPDFGAPEVPLPEFGNTHSEGEAGFMHGDMKQKEENIKAEGLLNDMQHTVEIRDMQHAAEVKLEPGLEDGISQILDDQNLLDVEQELRSGEAKESLGNDENHQVVNMQKQEDTKPEVHNGKLEPNLINENSSQILDIQTQDDSKLDETLSQPRLDDEQRDSTEINLEPDYDTRTYESKGAVDSPLIPEPMEEDRQPQAYHLDLFEIGCVIVEFLREEAACTAAHCLNGRTYDGRTVEASYVPHNRYLARFLR